MPKTMQYRWLKKSIRSFITIVLIISFLTVIRTLIFFRWSIPEGKYKLNPEWAIFRFFKNGSYMYTIAALKPSSAFSVEIVFSYLFPQFYCAININSLRYGLGFQELQLQASSVVGSLSNFLLLDSSPSTVLDSYLHGILKIY